MKPRPVHSWWAIILSGRVQQDWRDPRDMCPVNAQEAIETGIAVMRLPPSLREVMIQEHVVGGTQQQKADGLQIDPKTFYRRCHRSYALLIDIMQDVAMESDA